MRRVVVTGIGVVSPLGNDADTLVRGAIDGRSGIDRFEAPFVGRMQDPVAAVATLDDTRGLEPAQLRMLDRVARFALNAANDAVDAAGEVFGGLDRARAGVFLGTGMGGSGSMDDGYRTLYEAGSDRVKPFTVLAGMHNAPAAWVGMVHGLRGASLTYSTACSSSNVSIGEAWLRIASGQLDVALAGGAEAPLSFGSLKAWDALHTLAAIDEDEPTASCRPFSKHRRGMVLGEGAAVLVLEPRERAIARGARILGEVAGYGVINDGGHITRPSVAGQVAAMRAALDAANVSADAIDAVNAHATGTVANDGVETAALRELFGARADAVPVSATKSMHGHLLGAAGALECALSLLAMRERVLLPTMHLDRADPECDLDYVANASRPAGSVRTMLSSSFAFGGTNAVLVLRSAG